MKCRTDFVTNSSSSSFILGKKDDDISVDTVYSIIRDLYIEYCSQKTKLIEYIKSVPNFGLHYNEKKESFILRFWTGILGDLSAR